MSGECPAREFSSLSCHIVLAKSRAKVAHPVSQVAQRSQPPSPDSARRRSTIRMQSQTPHRTGQRSTGRPRDTRRSRSPPLGELALTTLSGHQALRIQDVRRTDRAALNQRSTPMLRTAWLSLDQLVRAAVGYPLCCPGLLFRRSIPALEPGA